MVLYRNKNMRKFILFCILTGFFLIISCITPYQISGGQEVYAVCDYLHCGVLVTEELTGGNIRYTHYTFVDEDWYVHGNLDFGGLIDALFRKSPSALEISVHEGSETLEDVLAGLNYSVTPDAWRFHVPEDKVIDGLDYIHDFVVGDEGEEITVWNYNKFEYTFFSTEQTYHIFYNCMNFTAYTLQYMGIDINASWYVYTNPIIRRRLNKLTPMISFD